MAPVRAEVGLRVTVLELENCVQSSKVRFLSMFQRYSGLLSEEHRGEPHAHHPESDLPRIRLSPFCGSRLSVEHSRCQKNAGLLLNPSPFLELSSKLYPDTARMALPACLPQGPYTLS